MLVLLLRWNDLRDHDDGLGMLEMRIDIPWWSESVRSDKLKLRTRLNSLDLMKNWS